MAFRTASGRLPSATLGRAIEGDDDHIAAELYREENEIISDSFPLVPVDTGTLRSTGYATEPEVDATDHMHGEVGYGGPATKINPKTGEASSVYGLAVHENLDAHHVVGQAKFLEVPFMAKLSGMAQRIAEGVRRRRRGEVPL